MKKLQADLKEVEAAESVSTKLSFVSLSCCYDDVIVHNAILSFKFFLIITENKIWIYFFRLVRNGFIFYFIDDTESKPKLWEIEQEDKTKI